MTMGTMNTPSDTGYDGKDLDQASRGRPARSTARPTSPIGPKGDIYSRTAMATAASTLLAEGELKHSWGVPGKGPGQFHLPHGIAVAADGRVFVCDREDDRIQIFSPDGEYLREWTDTQRPTHLCFDARGRAYVTELAWHRGRDFERHGPDHGDPRYARMSVYDKDGRCSHAGARRDAERARQLRRAAWPRARLEERLYVSEVTWTFAVSRGLAPEDCHTFQKFALTS